MTLPWISPGSWTDMTRFLNCQEREIFDLACAGDHFQTRFLAGSSRFHILDHPGGGQKCAFRGTLPSIPPDSRFDMTRFLSEHGFHVACAGNQLHPAADASPFNVPPKGAQKLMPGTDFGRASGICSWACAGHATWARTPAQAALSPMTWVVELST